MESNRKSKRKTTVGNTGRRAFGWCALPKNKNPLVEEGIETFFKPPYQARTLNMGV